MKRCIHFTLATAALALVFGGWQVSTAQAQGHTYPNYYGSDAERVVLRPGKCQRHRHLHESESVPPVQRTALGATV